MAWLTNGSLAPPPPEWQTPTYGRNVGQLGAAGKIGGSSWATGDANIDQYIGALDAAMRGGRVGGATAMARDIAAAKQLASLGTGGGNVDVNSLPNFGGGAGGSGGATLRANPYEARLNSLLDNPDSIANTAGYKFEMDQGQQALARSAAAKGMTGSGNTLAALLEHGQGLAATRRGQEVDRLSSLVQGRDSVNANLYGTDVGANTSRYATDVGSKTSMWNTAQKINADNYWNAQKLAQGGGGGGTGWSSTLGGTGGNSNFQLPSLGTESGATFSAQARRMLDSSSQQSAWDQQWANRNNMGR